MRGIEKEMLSEFSEITASITNIINAINIRQRFMKALHNPIYLVLLEYFVSQSVISDEWIKEIFEIVSQYHDSKIIDRLPLFQEINKLFTAFLDTANTFHSIFTQKCIVAPISKIMDIIKDDILHNDAIKPANIILEAKNRKYPLHIQSRDIDIKLSVKNNGPGHAFKTQIEVHDSEGISIINKSISLGDLGMGSADIIFRAVTANIPSQRCSIIGEVYWLNFDSTQMKTDFYFELTPQRSDLDWDKLSLKKPYSLEAVETENDLVGRSEIFKALSAKIFAEKIESSIIFGQKRVGKTSIAKTLYTKLLAKTDYTTIFVKIGDLDKNTPVKLVNNMAEEIVIETTRNPIFYKFETPKFDGALAPIIRYFKSLKHFAPNHRFIIIIDEFDELPVDLYHYTNIGDTFFHNIRSLSDENYIGIILVGGENMQIIKQSTDRLNKFDTFKVDYFDRGKYWNDFQDLVSNPVFESIEYSNNSIVRLYEMTEGNPFFTKLICGKAYMKACDTRNAYVSSDDIEEAIRESISSLDINHVNHFWKDSITVDEPTVRDEIETQRRKFLIAFADIKRRDGNVNRKALEDSKILVNLVAISEMIESFRVRGILVENDGYFRLKPKFFEQWLIEFGSQLITTIFLDKQAIDVIREKENKAYVTDTEIVNVSKSWGLYRGMQISSIEMRSWLDQFENNTEKRLMFTLLKKLKFYDEVTIREKVRIIHNTVKNDLVHEIKSGERVRHDLLLSSFGKPSKSGSSLARIYATENKVSSQNIAAFDRIPSVLEKTERIRAIVLIDDIIGSGGTAVDALEEVDRNFADLLKQKGVKLVFASICGLSDGIEYLESIIKEKSYRAEISICDILTNSDKCFSAVSEIFESPEERIEAEKVALKYGKRIAKDIPLGYANGQLLVVFKDNCPDNSLPILWASSKGIYSWTPIFRRN